jgi:NTE family protein
MNKLNTILSYFHPNNTVGLCLGGGGALGFAHLGVLQALEEHQIYPQEISGASMGAIIGALYAAGYSPAEIILMVRDEKLYKVTNLMNFPPTFLKSGLSTHSMLRQFIQKVIPHNSFELLNKKLQVCVTNLNNSKWEMINTGNELDKWVAASASVPGVFESIKQNNCHYIDGGVLNNFPAQCLSKSCNTIIGVDVLPPITPQQLNKPIDTIVCSIRAIQHQNSLDGRSKCQFLIEPKGVNEFHEFSFEAYLSIYKKGYEAAMNYIQMNPKIKKNEVPTQYKLQND